MTHTPRFARLGVFIAGLAAAVFWPEHARADLIGHGGTVRSVAVSPDGTRVLSGSFDYSAILWDFADQTEIAVLDGHEGPVNDVAFSADGAWALTASDDGRVRVFDAATGAAVRTIEAHDHKVMGVTVSETGAAWASAGWDRIALVFQPDGAVLHRIKHPAPVNAVAFVGGGSLVATGSHDGRVRLFRMSDGEPAGVLEGHGLGITRIVAVDDTRIASSGIDGSIRLWDLSTMSELKVLEKHDGQVYALSVLADGALLSGGRDGQLLRWSLETGAVVDAFKAHDRMVWSVAPTPDDRFVVTAGLEAEARVWHLDSHDRIGLSGSQTTNAEADRLWKESDHPGAPLYSKCAQCHTLTADGPKRSGPHLEGLFGRKVGTVSGYRYSEALQTSDIVWTDQTVFDLFHLGPDKVLPGTKMPVQKVTDSEALVMLVDFLKTVTGDEPQPESQQ